MTDKEKAKVYDEALKKASAAHKDEDRHLKATLEIIFPELKESEDEKIKNAILNLLKKMWGNCQDDVCGVHVADAIDWLEKQGRQNLPSVNERAWLYLVSDVLTWKDGLGQYLDDQKVQEFAKILCSRYAQKLYNHSNSLNTEKNEQKSSDKTETRFKVGNWVVFIPSKSVYQIEKKENYGYTLRHTLGGSVCLPFSNEELIREWTIQDAMDGDVLALSWMEDENLFEKIVIFKKYHSEGIVLYNAPCVEGYGNTFKNGKIAFTDEKVPYYSKSWTCNLQPATKEQRDILMKAMNDAGYEWDIEKKELKKKCKR